MRDSSGPTLKHPTGWFAAGREMLRAVSILSDGAFKLYVHICLCADRANGKLRCDHGRFAKALNKSRRSIGSYVEELRRRGVCEVRQACNQHQDGEIEVCDSFWPYRKIVPHSADPDGLADYKARIRDLLGDRRCVKACFSPADEKLAEYLFRRKTPIDEIERAMLLGCARKYVALINGESQNLITSLNYFQSVLDEVSGLKSSPDYWRYLSERVRRLERQWLDRKPAPRQRAERS